MVRYKVRAELQSYRIYVYKPCSIRKRTLGSISCNTTTSRSLRPTPLNWVPSELLQDSGSSLATIGPHWPSSYPEYLSPHQDKDEQWRIVWARLTSQRSNLAKSLSKQNEQYRALSQELNPRTTQVESSHDPLYHDRTWFYDDVWFDIDFVPNHLYCLTTLYFHCHGVGRNTNTVLRMRPYHLDLTFFRSLLCKTKD